MAAVSEANDVNWWNSVRHKLHRVKCTMMKHPDLVCLFVFTLFWMVSKYSKSSASKQVFNAQPPPETVFPAHSPVHDSFTGSLAYLHNQIREEELVIVMFYAPWSVQALEAREEYHKAAEIVGEQLSFLAVNCWWPSGQCVKKYRFYSYPAIYVYHHQAHRFRYSGPITAEHLVQFLERFLYPMTPIHTETRMKEFMVAHNPCVLGHFDFHDSPQPPGLKQYYFTALRSLQKDPIHPLRFGVIVNPVLASSYNMSRTPCVQYNNHLHYINKSFTLDNFTSTNIQLWLSDFSVYRPSISWLQLPRRKSRHLRDWFKLGPSLLVFLPNNPLYHNLHYTNMQKLLFEYRACDNRTMGSSRYLDQYVRRTLRSQTNNCAPKQPTSERVFCCSSLTLTPHYQRCNVCQSTPRDLCDMSKILSNIHNQKANFKSTMLKCSERRYNYNYQQWLSLCCETSHRQTVTPRSKDPNVRRLRYRNRVMNCAKLKYSQEKGLLTPSTMSVSSERYHVVSPVVEGFRGLSCRTNRTFSVNLLDSNLHDNFRRSLQLEDRRDTSIDVVLVDSKREELYLLRKPFTRHSMAEFITNYTLNLLPRTVRVSALPPSHLCTQDGDCIREVNALNFRQVVLDDTKDVVLLHYATWCGQCVSMTDTYFRLARFFKSSPSLVFARVNGETNDLPWPYTTTSYPVLQYYPAKRKYSRKSESITLPEQVPRTLPNLVTFVLKHTSSQVRLEVVSNLCSGPCQDKNRQLVTQQSDEAMFDLSLLYSRMENSGIGNSEYQKESHTKYQVRYLTDLRNRIQEIEKRMDLTRRLDKLLSETTTDPINIKHLNDLNEEM